MNIPRRRFLHLVVGAAVLPPMSRIARAETYPARPVRWIVPQAPGGASDVSARLMGQLARPRVSASGVVTLESPAPGRMRDGFALALRETCVDLATNPIILAILAGLALRLSGVGLPPMVDAAFALLGQATLPCVLVAIGLGLGAFNIKGHIGIASGICLFKLVVQPLTAWVIAHHLLRLPATEVAVITLLSAMPTGANAYIFASRQGSGEAAVSATIALSTVLSAVTIALVLAFLSQSP